MADTLFIVPFQVWVYGMVHNMAVRLWLADRAFLLAGLMVQVVNEWLVNELFGPAISDFLLLSRGLLPTFFTIAVFLLAFGYLAAPFFHIQVVSLGKAVGWLLFALLFYQVGPGLYVEGEQLRRALSSEFYAQVLDRANAAPTGGPMAILSSIANGPDDAMGALDNQFGAFVPSDQYVDGLDLAMAYTLSTGDDVVYALTPAARRFPGHLLRPGPGAAVLPDDERRRPHRLDQRRADRHQPPAAGQHHHRVWPVRAGHLPGPVNCGGHPVYQHGDCHPVFLF